MKRALVLSLALLMISSALAFATGPLLGFSVVPTKDAEGVLTVGFNVAAINLEIQRSNLQNLDGKWSLGILWVPQQGNFGYRAGARVVVDYDYTHGRLYYDGFEFVVGVSNTWGPLQLYLDANIAPTGALGVVPIVGFNLLFSELIPDADVAI